MTSQPLSQLPESRQTSPTSESDAQEKETKKKKTKRTKASTPTTPRRSSRIRQKSGSQSESGASDVESEDGSKGQKIEKLSQMVDPLPALEEDKEIVFSPPRSKTSKTIPVADSQPSTEPITFSLPKRTRKRSANEVDDVTDSPAKKTRQTPVKTRPETPSTPRRSGRRIRQPNI